MRHLNLEGRVDHGLGPRQYILIQSAGARGEAVSWRRGRVPPPAVAPNRACHLAHSCTILGIVGGNLVVPGDTHITSPTLPLSALC